MSQNRLGQINADRIKFIQQTVCFLEERIVSQSKKAMQNFIRMNGVKILAVLLIWVQFVECRYQECVTSDDLRKRICYYEEKDKPYQFVSCDETKCEAQPDSSSCLETKYYYNQSECLHKICGFSEGQGDFQSCRETLAHIDYTPLIICMSVVGFILLLAVFVALAIMCGWFKAIAKMCKKQERNGAQSRPQQRVANLSNTNDHLQGNQIENTDHLNHKSQKNSKQSQSNNQPSAPSKPHDRKKQISFQKFKIFMTEDDFDQGFVPKHPKEQNCCICLNSEELNCQTACNHFYHYNCLIEWGKKSPFCPCCRSKNFLPAKLFCISCGKIIDIFGLKKQTYAGKSKVGIEFFNQLQECKQCRINKLSQITNFNFF